MIEQPSNSQGAPLWKVEAPKQTTMLTAAGTYAPGWQIPVTMADGSGFMVEVSAQDFNPDKVRQLINEHVDKILAVRGLEGPPF